MWPSRSCPTRLSQSTQCLTHIQKIQDALGRDLEHARTSNGTIGGRLHEFVTDVFSKWPQDTAECDGCDNKLHEETARSGTRAFRSRSKLRKTRTANAHQNPTSNLQRATLLEHSDMDKMDQMAVDKWRPKLATDVPAHVLTILDNVDQKVRTSPGVTIELSKVVSWYRAWHQLDEWDKMCHDTARGSVERQSQRNGHSFQSRWVH